jgi:hypothetical protein
MCGSPALDINSILPNLSSDDWNARCIEQLPLQQDKNFTQGLIHLVDALGRRVQGLSN